MDTGCVTEAAARAGVSTSSVYRHQESDPAFCRDCADALAMASTPLELTAWRRAVVGVEQEFACGGQVHVRRRYDGSLLRLLLQGSNPKKYGPRPGFKRKRILKHDRKQMEREIEAELTEKLRLRSLDEVHESILRKLGAVARKREPERIAAGWTKSPDGEWVPPGFAPIPGWHPPLVAPGGTDPSRSTPGDSMWSSSHSSSSE